MRFVRNIKRLVTSCAGLLPRFRRYLAAGPEPTPEPQRDPANDLAPDPAPDPASDSKKGPES